MLGSPRPRPPVPGAGRLCVPSVDGVGVGAQQQFGCGGGERASLEGALRAVVRGALEFGHSPSPLCPSLRRAGGVGVRCPLAVGADVRASAPVARELCGVLRAAGAGGGRSGGEPLTAVARVRR